MVVDSDSDREGSQPAHSRGWHAAVGLLPVILLILASLGAWMVRWTGAPSHASGDTFWYSRTALEDAGWAPEAATVEAARLALDDPRAGADSAAVANWIRTAATIDPRYPAIFDERPLYPLTATPFLVLLGPAGMVVPVLVGALIAGAAVGWLVVSRTGRPLVGVATAIALFALPTGAAMTLEYADALMLGLWAVALAAASTYLARPRRRWLVVLAVAAVLMGWTKLANEVALAAALLGVAGYELLRRRPWRTAAALAAVAGVAVVVQLLVLQVSGAAGLMTSVQDLLTRHFADPDVANPITRLIRIDLGLVKAVPGRVLGMSPLDLLAFAGGAVGLVLAPGRWRLPWIAGAVATLGVVALHPVGSEIPRLLAPVWLTVVVGLGLLLNAALDRATAPQAAGARPVVGSA